MSFPWKKLAIISLCAGAGVVIALGGSALAIYRYEHPSTPRKDWPAFDMPAIGLRAHIYTEMRAGTVAYMFYTEPLSSKFEEDFGRVASDSTIQKSFDITLRDKGNFQLCREEVTGLIPRFDEAGKAGQLSSEGTIFCPARDYLEATHWEVVWTFPRLSESKPKESSTAGATRP